MIEWKKIGDKWEMIDGRRWNQGFWDDAQWN